MNKPLMAKATAVWLVDNTTLSFKQIADFCGMHELEVQGIADGDLPERPDALGLVAEAEQEAEHTRGTASRYEGR